MIFEMLWKLLSEGAMRNTGSFTSVDMRVRGKLLIGPLEEAYALTFAESITDSSIDITTLFHNTYTIY
jgi:hypothetical protein